MKFSRKKTKDNENPLKLVDLLSLEGFCVYLKRYRNLALLTLICPVNLRIRWQNRYHSFLSVNHESLSCLLLTIIRKRGEIACLGFPKSNRNLLSRAHRIILSLICLFLEILDWLGTETSGLTAGCPYNLNSPACPEVTLHINLL